MNFQVKRISNLSKEEALERQERLNNMLYMHFTYF